MADTKTYTTNYNLEKPGQDDFYDVAIFNANADKTDTELKAAATRDTTHKNATTLDHPDNSVTDAKIGNRTITDTVTAASGANTITNLFSMLGNMIKRITGKTTWWTPPATTLEAANTHITAATGAHAASAVAVTATGDVSAPNVQDAIAELATKKLPARNSFNSLLCFYRDLVGYSSGTTLVTGAVKILLPINWGNTMMSIEISGYHNGTNPQSFNVQLAAYARALSSEWQVPTALVTPGSPFTSIRFAYDSVAGKPCILLGTTASNWSNLYLVIKEMVAGQSTVTSYGSGWEVSLITSETGITGIVTAAITPLLSTANSLAGNTIYKYRDVAAYHSGSTSLTGTAKITLPVSWVSTTLILEIEGWNSAGTNSSHWKATVSGFSNSAQSTWQLPAATLFPNCPFSSVRLGFDSVAGKCCVLLGTTSTAWDNVKIVVKEVLAGHYSVSSYATGWDISVITTETGITNIATPVLKTLATVEGTAPITHATAAATYGLATAALYGHAMASSANPLMDGTASPGTDNGKYAREGHVHPIDTSRAPLASPAFTGIATAVTAALGTNTTQIATTAFVQAALAAVNGKVVAFNLGASGGYVAWDFGLTLQWGKYTNTSGNVIATVTLPINYTNSYVPFATPRGSNYYTGNASAYADVVSLNQIKLVLDEDNGGPASDLFWFTIGF